MLSPAGGGDPAPVPAPYRAAAIQFDPVMFRTAENVHRLLALCEEAAAGGAKLIVTPEMATTGYCWADRAEIAPEVEPIPGPTTARFAEVAARFDCWIVLGLAEVAPETGVYYNSAALIGPHGIAGRYRKTHAYISEPKWAKDGDLGLPVFETPLGRLAIAICMDASYPEATRVPALAGADVVCFPTNWLSEKAPSPTWIARALESGLYLVAANRAGCERGVQFDGGSCLIDPDGTVQAWLDAEEGIVYGEIDLARARTKRPGPASNAPPGRTAAERPARGTAAQHDPAASEHLLADRRPDAYGSLTLHTYLWNPREFHGLYGLRPLPEGRRSRVAVAQFAPAANDRSGNLARIDAAAAEAGADLLVCPELAVCGPIANRAAAEAAAEPIPGPTTERLREIAARHGSFLIAGRVERDGPRLFNAAVLVGPEGLVGVYRKLHPTAADRSWATPGDRGLPTFDVPVGRVGILIGYDALFPEAARCLAIAGADLIACPALVTWPPVQPWGATAVPMPPFVDAGPTTDHFHLWRERARENTTPVLFANGGAPWLGRSGVFGGTPEDEPRQEALVRGDGGGIASIVIDTTNLDSRYTTVATRAKDLVRMRMPIWYDALQAPVGAKVPAAPAIPSGADAVGEQSENPERRPGTVRGKGVTSSRRRPALKTPG